MVNKVGRYSTSDSSNQGWPIHEEYGTEVLDIDFEPPATIEIVDEGIKLSTINKTVDAKGELLVERTPKVGRLGHPCAQQGA